MFVSGRRASSWASVPIDLPVLVSDASLVGISALGGSAAGAARACITRPRAVEVSGMDAVDTLAVDRRACCPQAGDL